MLGQMLMRLERAHPEATRLPHAQGSPNPSWLLQFPVGWRIYYEEQEFQSQVPSYHAKHQLVQRGHSLFCKAVKKLTKWAEVPPFYLACIPMYVSSGSNGGLYGMLQLFSHSAPLFHYRDGMPLHAMFFPSTFLHLIEQYSINATKFITHSLCIGAAGAGLPSDTIQKLVRWRSSVYETYTCHLLTHPSDTRTMAAAQ